MEIRALGPIELVTADGVATPGSTKPALALAVLLSEQGRVVSADRLELALWGDDPPRSAAHAIHVHVSRLRSTLGTTPDGSDVVETVGDGYRILLDEGSYDVVRFEGLVAEAGDAAPSQAAERLSEALGLWRGRPFGELGDNEVVATEARRLVSLRDGAIDDLIGFRLELGADAELIPEIEDELANRPLEERLWQALMLALYRAGRQAEALRAFGRLRALLAEELGIEPSAESRDLETQMLLQDPGLDSAPGRRDGNLPAPLTPLEGRGSEIDELLAMIDSNRLTTVLGPPGIGKSRVALAAAEAWRSRTGGACWYFEVGDEQGLISADLAAILGVEGGASDPIQSILEALAGVSLLVVDGCERGVGAVGSLVSSLLQAHPDLRALATSTRRLEIGGEAVLALQPLASEAAAELFIARASSTATHNLDLETDRGAIDEICARIEGVPLAIELLAARVDVLTPAQILERLEHDLSLLQNRADEHRDALDAALDWSVGLVSPRTRDVYLDISVFRGGFDLTAAEAISTDDGVVDHLSVLVSHSLLSTSRVGGETRYRMLEAVRQHADRELTMSGRSDALRLAHATYFRDWSKVGERGLTGPDQLEWLVRFDTEHANLREALDHSVAHQDPEAALDLVANVSWFWFLRSLLREGWFWLGQVLPLAESDRSTRRVRALIRASQFAWEQAANDQAREWLAVARQLAAELGSEHYQAWTSVHLAMLDLMDGDDEGGLQAATEARATFERLGNPIGLGFAVFLEAVAPVVSAVEEDEPDVEAIQAARESLSPTAAAAVSLGELNLVGHLDWALGLLAVVAGDLADANARLETSTRAFIELGNLSCLSHSLDAVAMLLARGEQGDQAARVLGMVRALRHHTGNPGHRFENRLHRRAADLAAAAIGTAARDKGIDVGADAELDEILAAAWRVGEVSSG